ncbi:MAG TPA: LemA family protein [Verrucomicrobiales bacterium]|jgi:LemA protein|nr:LemA family protein [Verrucomicrobiales bacterium]
MLNATLFFANNGLFITLGVVLGIGLILILWIVALYNGLVGARNRYKNGFAQIDVQLKRRYDLIPNLVEVAKGYMKHERETLEAVIAARNSASSARATVAANPADAAAVQSLNTAEAGLAQVMTRFMALSEAYPDLKANANMQQLTEELTSTENRIAFARQAYNDSVMDYNNKREMFPSSIIAGMFNFAAAQMFEVKSEAEREAVKVSFS